MPGFLNGGDGGIRTHGTLLGYAHLANEYLRPLGHVSIRGLLSQFRFETQRRRRKCSQPRLILPVQYATYMAFTLRRRPDKGHDTVADLLALTVSNTIEIKLLLKEVA